MLLKLTGRASCLPREDPIKVGEQVQKKIDLARSHLSRPALLSALALLLPGSRYAATLSLIPLPEPTVPGAKPSATAFVQHAVHTAEGTLDLLEEIVRGWETQEAEQRAAEIDKRRQRLGGGRAKTRAQIEREVFAELARDSKLPGLYADLLNHPALPVDRLREVEHALLLHHRTLLFAIPSKEKEAKRGEREKVLELSRGVVLIRGADRDAWEAQLEWADRTTIGASPASTGSFHAPSLIVLLCALPPQTSTRSPTSRRSPSSSRTTRSPGSSRASCSNLA